MRFRHFHRFLTLLGSVGIVAGIGLLPVIGCTTSGTRSPGAGGNPMDAAAGGSGANSRSGGTLGGGGTQGLGGTSNAGGLANGGSPTTGGTKAGGAGGGGGGGGGTTSGVITDCTEGLVCPQAGLQCTNAAGVACLCNGPPGSAILNCNVVSTSSGGRTANGGAAGTTSATGGAKAGSGGSTLASGGGGGSTLGGGGGSGGLSSTGGSGPQACSGTAPWSTGNGDVQIAVDASKKGSAWSRFYEKGVACDHANTLLSTAYGRNAQAALKKGHDLAGFQYVRFHGVLNDDIAVYSESNGTAVYDWTRFDQVYDAIIAAGMRPIVEISFTPSAMGSANTILTSLWYNNKSPNISKPKDWSKWEAFMAAIVQHLESRYGADEVRNNWFFEVWNEPSWMYAGGDSGYNELYGHTAKGLAAGDSGIRIGGPAGSAGESPSLIAGLVSYAKSNNYKLDFVSFHSYANDNNRPRADASSMLTFYDSISNTLSSSKFTGIVINDEYGSSFDTVTIRDSEVSASFVAKTVHLVGTQSKAGPPFMYAWWAISDLYEEIDTGVATAFREGNYGLLVKGDPAIPVSFDVAKPVFNAFRLLHMMGDTQLSVSGGTTNDGVNAVATVSSDGSAIQVLVYNHVNAETGDSSKASQVRLTVSNLPWSGTVNVRHIMLDRTHGNAYQTWVGLGKPAKPSQSQWTTIASAAELCTFGATTTGASWTVTYPQNVYGVSLFTLSP